MNFLTIWFKIKLKFGFIFREGVKSIILEIFAGPADRGEYSPSVQNTLYLTAQKVFEKMPEVSRQPSNQIYLPNLYKLCCRLCLISHCEVFYLFSGGKSLHKSAKCALLWSRLQQISKDWFYEKWWQCKVYTESFVIVNKSNLVAHEYCRFLIKLVELISA